MIKGRPVEGDLGSREGRIKNEYNVFDYITVLFLAFVSVWHDGSLALVLLSHCLPSPVSWCERTNERNFASTLPTDFRESYPFVSEYSKRSAAVTVVSERVSQRQRQRLDLQGQ